VRVKCLAQEHKAETLTIGSNPDFLFCSPVCFILENCVPPSTAECAVPENIHTPPTEGIGIAWGWGVPEDQKYLKKCMKLNWNFQRGGEVLEKTLAWGRYGYFLELHNACQQQYPRHCSSK